MAALKTFIVIPDRDGNLWKFFNIRPNCRKGDTSPQAPKECLRAIMKRLNNPDPHVAIQAVTLLDACVSNCGLPFHLEVASRDFEQEYRKLLNKTHERAVRDKLLHCLQKWAENEFKSDPQLDLIPTLYQRLKQSGTDFPADTSSPSKSKKLHSHSHKPKEHHSGTSGAATNAAQQEADDIAKAIELSLQENQKSQQSKSLYPQVASSGLTSAGAKVEKEPRKVRALYDFEAAEENELTFYAGEIVHVTDDSDPNWWEGTNQRGQGLFPSNFVTADLSAEPPKFETASNPKKQVQFSEEVVVKSVEVEPAAVEIDEAKIDEALHMLHDLDPTGETPDPPGLAALEDQVEQMGPLIDQELEKIDRRHVQLTKLGSELVDALNMYHNLMRGQPLMTGPYQQTMGNKIPVSGPASMPNFQPGMPMPMPGYSPYYDPNGVPHMMNHPQMMRPPNSAPPGPGMYHGMVPQQMMIPPVHNGLPGQMPQQQPPMQQQHHIPSQIPQHLPQHQIPQQQQQPIVNNMPSAWTKLTWLKHDTLCLPIDTKGVGLAEYSLNGAVSSGHKAKGG
ncbi:unnamed protein product [Allacma fusca]|uniref:Signal transducing adapter molecule 1 n=1 Tax=Allacma fusca TaxID=39272 RepID=A0A8J2LAY7_9HEXA|nr:unnamed protein product [Allacma fusca]